jgi:glycosyltransferase involved in cell wall biosynthesis
MLGSPVRQTPKVLEKFLESIEKQTVKMDCVFIDDNTEKASSDLLKAFGAAVIPGYSPAKDGNYARADNTHHWDDTSIWKVAGFKDYLIEYTLRREEYDYLFLIDSDLVLHPDTISQLLKAKKDIITNIFWTSWQPGMQPEPNVWLQDEYDMFVGRNLSDTNKSRQAREFLAKLQVPGVYEVGGLGACTLLSRRALEKGVRFAKIPGLGFWGEDRHFSVRAQALGLELFVDTHHPAKHLYRDSDLDTEVQPRITLSMIVHNEGNRYLTQVLEAAKEYITDAVIIDDASDDDTLKVVCYMLKDIPFKIVHNSVSKFSNEIELRKQQWEETLDTNPEWILTLDADEIFDGDLRSLDLKDPSIDAYYFRLFDMWDSNHYRDDQFWGAHNSYRPFLIRYNDQLSYEWKETAQHCGRFPLTINNLSYQTSEIRLKHLGWAMESDRKAKYDRYMKLDPDGTFGWKAQYESILDANPNLVAF